MQRHTSTIAVAVALLVIPWTAGCPTGGGDAPVAGDEGGIKRYALSELSPLGDTLPPLDGGRIEVSVLNTAKVLPRSQNYLAGFYFGDPASLPRILLTAEPSPYGEITTVTEANVERFAALVAARFESEGVQLIEPVRPLILGDRPVVRYVRGAKFQGVTADRQVVQTVVDGRLYTVDLQVFAGMITRYRNDAYAVAAGLRFPTGGGSAASPASDPAPDDAPATDTPATDDDS